MRGLALRALKTSAAAADRLHSPRRGIVVLIYHCVGRGSGLELDLPVERFDEQMARLAAESRVVSLDARARRARRARGPGAATRSS